MLYSFFAGDFPITIMIYAIVWFATRSRHSMIRHAMFGDSPIWNRVGQGTVLAGLIFPLWVAVADNWRQLLSYSPFLPSDQRWQSDPFQTPATLLGFRIVTVVLGVLLVVGLAALYARRGGTLWIPVVAILTGALLLNFIDPIRMRVDALMLQTQSDLSSPQPFNDAFIIFWAIGLYFLLAIDILGGIALAWGILAIPARIIGWLATRRSTPDEAPIFHVYRRQVEQLHAGGPHHDGSSRDLTRH